MENQAAFKQPSIELVELKRSELHKFFQIFEEARSKGELGYVAAPESLADVVDNYDRARGRYKLNYFLVRALEDFPQVSLRSGNVVGAIATFSDLEKGGGVIFNQFVKNEYRRLGFGTASLRAAKVF